MPATPDRENSPADQQARTASPRVSVIMPVFNGESYVRRAIASALAQSLAEAMEIIVVDDASDDGTCDAVLSFGDPRVRLIRSPVNRGPSHARNVAIEAARGEWIALLDADDWYAGDRLERLLSCAAQQQADAVADDMFIAQEGQSGPAVTWFQEYAFTVDGCRLLTTMDMAARELGAIKPVFRRALFAEQGYRYDTTVTYGEDLLLYLNWLVDGVRFAVLGEPLYYLRRGDTGSLTTHRIALAANTLRLHERLLKQEKFRAAPGVENALRHRMRATHDMLTFHTVLAPLRARQYWQAVRAAAAHPGFLLIAARRLPQVAWRRLRRVGLRMRAANAMTAR